VKPAVKVLCGVGIALALLLVIFLALVKLLVTPERVREAIAPLSSQIFSQPVEIGGIDIDPFSGISLQRIVIPDASGLPVLQVEQAVLRYRFWPLFSGRLLVDKVRLVHPVARILRHADGRWQLAGLAVTKEPADNDPGPAGSVTEPMVETPSEEGGLPLGLLVSSIEMDSGQLEVVDRSLNKKAPYKFSLQDISISAQNLSLETPFRVSASLKLNQGRVEMSGLVDPLQNNHDLQVHIVDLDLAPLAPYFKDKLPGIFSRARVQGQLGLSGSRDDFRLKGEFGLEQVFMQLESLPRTPIRNASLRVAPQIRVNSAQGSVTIDQTLVTYNGISLTILGNINHLGNDPRLEMKVSVQDQGVRDLFTSLPSGLLPQFEQLDAAGTISGSLGLRGRLKDPASLLQAGDLTLDAVQVNLGHLRPALSGQINLVGHGLAGRELALRVGDETAVLQLAVRDLLSRPLEIQSRLSAASLDIDKLLLPAQKVVAAETANGSPPQPGSNGQTASAPAGTETEPGPLNLPLVADGSLHIDKVIAHGLPIDNLLLDYHLADNRLEVRRMSGTLAGGRFEKNATIDLGQKGFAYQTDVQLQDVAAGPLLKVLLPEMQGTVSGQLSGQASLAGRGVTRPALVKNLRGEGTVKLLNGVADGTRLSRGLVALLGLDQLRQVTIREAAGRFRLDNGSVRIKGALAGRDLRMAPEGSLEFGGRVDLALPTSLAPEVAAKLGARGSFGRLLKDDQGWTMLPLKVEGTFADPKVSLDNRQLGRTAEKQLMQKLEKKLQKKLGTPESPAGKEKPTEKLLKDALRGLIGQ